MRECPVCLEETTSNAQWVIFGCHHATCRTCYAQLVAKPHQDAACPLCRSPLTELVPGAHSHFMQSLLYGKILANSTCNSFLQVPAVFALRRQVQIVDWVVTARCKCTVVLVSWHGADIFYLQNAVFGEIMFILCLQRRALRRWLSRCSRLRGSLPDQAGDKCLWVLHQWRLQAVRHSSGVDRAFCKCAAETLR